VPAEQFVPEGEVACNVVNFSQPLAVGAVIRAPVGQRIDVEVLAININPLAGQQAIDPLERPFPRLGIAQVQQPALLASQNPLGVLRGKPGTCVTRSGSNQTMNLIPLAWQ